MACKGSGVQVSLGPQKQKVEVNMLALFSITIFLSATLLFLIQPMFGKMILPLLGSTPNVWNTCMVFFQAVLLLGYIYAHASTTILGVKKQAIFHSILLLIPLIVLPIIISGNVVPPTDRNPVPWLLTLMLTSVGLPFFVVSASAPMLQKWFSQTQHKSSSDPYFLYVESNLGSIIALLGYPFLIEPNFRLIEQSGLWKIGYMLLITFTIGCAIVLWKSPNLIAVSEPEKKSTNDALLIPSMKQKILWILLAMAPSSLMLSVTTYISTDIASAPLLWVIPLTIYLLSFVIVFSKKPIFSHELMVRIMPIMVLPVMIYILSEQSKAIWLTMLLHLLTLFTASMVCHGELARTRPQAKYLTEFYLWISFGGFLGGLFNALIAPAIFKTVLEYPIALILACLLRPNLSLKKTTSKDKLLDFALPIALGILVAVFCLGFHTFDMKPDWLSNLLTFGIPAILCYMFATRPIRFGLGIAIVIMVISLCINSKANVLYTARSFFAVHRVILDSEAKYSEEKCHYLVHGRILHGAQSVNPENRDKPLTYFFPTGPIGQIFTSFANDKSKIKVAVVGLGAGTLVSYSKPWQEWTLYEIDPVVAEIASNEKYFTFLKDAKAKYKIILGDGRLSIKKAPNNYFDFIILDAFSSDSIPTHLVTKQATELYLQKLNKGGILAFQITNNYLDLKPVLGSLALGTGLTGFFQNDYNILEEEKRLGKKPSTWVVLARDKKDFGKIVDNGRWQSLNGLATRKIWTDDFSNILSVFKWKKEIGKG